MKKIYLFIIISILGYTACGSQSEFSVYPEPERLKIPAGDEGYVTVTAEMPGRSYIYGNPKGPGIGKPTVVSAKTGPGIRAGAPRYLPAHKYSPGDGDFVWVYRDTARFHIPVTVLKGTIPGTYQVEITFSALLCSRNSCTPKNRAFHYPVTVVPAGSTGTRYSDTLRESYSRSVPVTGMGTKKEQREPAARGNYFLDMEFAPEYFRETRIGGIIQAILFGIIAGFILNFMPCVLPVVSIKVMSFVEQAGKQRREVMLQGILFTLGILSSFLVLASLASFLGYNWGGLFQHREFLIAMTVIVFVLALSLFDVFTINVPAFAGRALQKDGNIYLDAFFKGLLATLLATPCSGPFLGGTLAWALTQHPAVIFVIFMSVGIGMALPYLVFSLRPELLRFVPKPGNWMVTLERVMGFLLMFTVIYLLSILEPRYIVPVITLLGFLAVGFWQFGVYGNIVRDLRTRVISLFVLLALTGVGFLFSFNLLSGEQRGIEVSSSTFTAERLMKNRETNTVTMVVFTADWCPNCRLVEQVAINTGDVRDLIRTKGIDFLVADITRSNMAAEQLMKKLGSTSIPLLAVFPPGENFTRPVVLRDIYSKQDLVGALEKASTGIESVEKPGKQMPKGNIPATDYQFEIELEGVER